MPLSVFFCFNEDSRLLMESIMTFCHTNDLEFIAYNEDIFNEKKKSYKIKGHFAARATPFCGIIKGAKIIKGFYSEAHECSEQTIKKWLTEHL